MIKSSHNSTALLWILVLVPCLCDCVHNNSRKDFQYAIIAFDEKEQGLFTTAKPTNLTKLEIDTVETILRQAVQQYNQGMKNERYLIKPLTNYIRQYIPVLNDKGEREVYVNCFCSTGDDKWKTEIVGASDGGNCYFHVKINLTAKTYSQLAVNGYG